MIISTIGNGIKGQDEEAFDLLQKMINRPGMFVGSSRFDYIDHLFTGYCLGRKSTVNFFPSKELQYWLLHTQSASLHGSINGATLFYRCFGTRNIAFRKYMEFLNTTIPQNTVGIDNELYAYENEFNIVRYDWEEDVPTDYYKSLAQSIYSNIKDMVARIDFICDEIKVYIRKEPLFNQVRFLVHGDSGWSDDEQIIVKPENHNNLIAIHASVRNAKVEDLLSCGYDVLDRVNYSDNTLPPYDSFTDEFTFLSEYLYWKKNNTIK